MCWIAEKGLTPLQKILREARLFVFPARPHDVLPRSHSEEEIEFLRESFFLPFPTIAVEDKASCLIIQDFDKDTRGIEQPRRFIEIMSSLTNLTNFCEGENPEYQKFP